MRYYFKSVINRPVMLDIYPLIREVCNTQYLLSITAAFSPIIHFKLYTEIQIIATNEDKNNFTPIVYRTSELELLDSGWLYYSGLNDMGSKSATWALFLHKKTNTHFIHINTHYYWTKDPAGQEARLSNSHELIGLYNDLIKKYPYPVVLTGDFNCRTDSEPIKMLFDAGFAESRLCAKQPVVPYRSSHKYPEIDDSDPENITYPIGHLPNSEIDTSIDHIFVGGLLSEKIKNHTKLLLHVFFTEREGF